MVVEYAGRVYRHSISAFSYANVRAAKTYYATVANHRPHAQINTVLIIRDWWTFNGINCKCGKKQKAG